MANTDQPGYRYVQLVLLLRPHVLSWSSGIPRVHDLLKWNWFPNAPTKWGTVFSCIWIEDTK